MNVRNILTEIYLSAEIKDCMAKLPNKYDKQDIVQHVFLELYSMPEEKVSDLHERGKLKHFIVKMIYNTSRFSKSSFAKQYGKETPTESFPELASAESEEEIIIPLDKLPVCKSGLPYMAEIFKLYAENGTYQKVSQITKINVTSIFNTVREAKAILKKHINT